MISALYLATAVGQPVVGRLIDVYGPRRLFLPATALVGLVGVIGTSAPDLAVLVVARVILGFDTCAGYPAAMRLIRDEAERTGKDSPSGGDAFPATVPLVTPARPAGASWIWTSSPAPHSCSSMCSTGR